MQDEENQHSRSCSSYCGYAGITAVPKLPVGQSLFFGVIKKGDLARERELFDLLNNDSEYSNSNRGYHLAYYGSGASEMSVIYSDEATADWDGPLQAFMRHFASSDTEHYYLRRIDLVTMRQFMEFRKKRAPVNDAIVDQIAQCLKISPLGANLEYQELVHDEFIRFKETYEKLV